MNAVAKISCCLERSVITLKLYKEYLNMVTHNISVLLWIYRTLFYVNIYVSYKLSNNRPFSGPSCTNSRN